MPAPGTFPKEIGHELDHELQDTAMADGPGAAVGRSSNPSTNPPTNTQTARAAHHTADILAHVSYQDQHAGGVTEKMGQVS